MGRTQNIKQVLEALVLHDDIRSVTTPLSELFEDDPEPVPIQRIRAIPDLPPLEPVRIAFELRPPSPQLGTDEVLEDDDVMEAEFARTRQRRLRRSLQEAVELSDNLMTHLRGALSDLDAYTLPSMQNVPLPIEPDMSLPRAEHEWIADDWMWNDNVDILEVTLNRRYQQEFVRRVMSDHRVTITCSQRGEDEPGVTHHIVSILCEQARLVMALGRNVVTGHNTTIAVGFADVSSTKYARIGNVVVRQESTRRFNE